MTKINSKENKAITLVALVITIILLLILSGITIVTLNNNNLIDKAKLAKKRVEEAQEEENIMLNNYENSMSQILTSNRNTVEETKTIPTTKGKYNFIKQGNIVYCSFYDKDISLGDYRQTTNGILLEELPYKIDETKYELFDVETFDSNGDRTRDTYFTSNVYCVNWESSAHIRVLNNGKLQVFFQKSGSGDSGRTVSGTFWYFTKD